MNELKIFGNPEFGQVRTMTDESGEPWFVGKDVADILGYANHSKAIADHVDNEDKLNNELLSSLGQRGGWLINESGLYSLILSSKMPKAKQFKHWVTSEVLPSIRKTGVYAAPTVDSSMMFKIAEAMRVKEKEISELSTTIEIQKQAIADMEPKLTYLDKILHSSGAMATTQIAADYSLSARKLNKILHEAGIQYNCNGQWILYKKYSGNGFTRSYTVDIVRSDGSPDTKLVTRWTQKGRLLIHQTLADRGIIANMDRCEQMSIDFKE